MKPRGAGIASVLLLLSCAAAAGTPSSAADFARPVQTWQMKLSPDGLHLASTVSVDGAIVLVITSLESRQLTATLAYPVSDGKPEHVVDFWWVSNRRVLAARAASGGELEGHANTGEFYGIDADGGRQAYLFGYRGEQSVGSHLKDDARTRATGRLIHALPDAPDHALIAVDYWSHERDGSYSTIEKLHVRTGTRVTLTRSPLGGFPDYLSNDDASRLLIAGTDDDGRWRLTRYRADADEWQDIALAGGAVARPLAFARDGTRAYLSLTGKNGTQCLAELADASAEPVILDCEAGIDLSALIMGLDGRRPAAVRYDGPEPVSRRLNVDDAASRLLARVSNSFPGQTVTPVSATRDGSLALLHVAGPTSPGDFFLFDAVRGKAEHAGSLRPWLEPEGLAPRRGFTIPDRSGRPMTAYVTGAATSSGRDPRPVVLLLEGANRPDPEAWAWDTGPRPNRAGVHGGPFVRQDSPLDLPRRYPGGPFERGLSPGWDRDAQFLASRGYTVVQIDPRGSAGRGPQRVRDGRGEADRGMLDDIGDGLSWLIEHGHIDDGPRCAVGKGWGGYTALLLAARDEPRLDCVVSYGGVTELSAWAAALNLRDSHRGERLAEYWLSRAGKWLSDPLAAAASIRTPVLLAHGERDRVVRIEQVHELVRKLRKADTPVSLFEDAGAAHGLRTEADLERWFRRLEAFLADQLAG